MVEVVPVDHIEEVLQNALVPENREGFLSKLRKLAVNPTGLFDPNVGRSAV
jgi:Lon-like ATP-dependent protease